MTKIIATLGLILGSVVWLPSPASAAPTVAASYSAGWNMVGLPGGTDVSSATYLSAYGANGYFTPAISRAAACLGYWAYFNAPATIPVSGLATGPTQSCNLDAGWNIVGNPFAGLASLPTGTVAYFWNPDEATYDRVTAIPSGGAVWIHVAEVGTITLTYGSTTSRSPGLLTIDTLNQNVTYNVHVGDSVKLVLPSATTLIALTDAFYLHVETSGVSGPVSCVGSTSCAINLVDRFWLWKAVNPGFTSIQVQDQCAHLTPPCAQPSYNIAVQILP